MISIDLDGTGVAHLDEGTHVPLRVVPHCNEAGIVSKNRFTIAIQGDDSDEKNDFVRDGDFLRGSFFDGEQTTMCTLMNYQKWKDEQMVAQV